MNCASPPAGGEPASGDVRDVGAVAAQVLLAAHPEAHVAYELTGAEALTYYEVAAILTRSLGRPITYQAVGIRAFQAHLARQGVPAGFRRVMTGIYLVARFGLASRVTPTVAQLLGRPPIALAQFATDYQVAWARPVRER